MSELYQKRLISEDDLRGLSHHHRYMMRHSSRHWPEYSSGHWPEYSSGHWPEYSSRHWPEYSSGHWLDSLVDMQSSKSADVHAKMFDTLRRFSLTEVVKERQTKPTGVTIHYFHLYVYVYMHAQSVSFVMLCSFSYLFSITVCITC